MKNLLLLLGIVLAGSACTNTDYHSYQFALLGDNPYSPPGYIRYLRMIEHVNAQPDLQWIVHLGDVKGGDSSCSDAELSRYFELNQLFEAPFIVTPGDNDWLDCKRASAGGFNDYERLAAFRRIFYPRAGYSTGGNPMPIMQQSAGDEFSEFVENAMWERDGVIFASVHVVALTEPATDPAQYARRTAAATAWIETAFNRAQQSNAKAVFLAMQAGSLKEMLAISLLMIFLAAVVLMVARLFGMKKGYL
ncbi:MAG: metallophosphoesterase [Proteobacteria bacterium]|nr:metallophosphoesterase [Pseudomonadota bacterium]